jgi:hypothetical protein
LNGKFLNENCEVEIFVLVFALMLVEKNCGEKKEI